MRNTIVILAALLALVPLAGCLEATEGTNENQPPNAELSADRPTAWRGETFQFDGTNSTDPDGEISSWRFDLGDGTVVTFEKGETPVVEHDYATGGKYTISLTVLDDAADGGSVATDTASLQIAVNENHTIARQVVFSGAAQEANTSGQFVKEFEVGEDAERFELNLTVENVLLVGATKVQVRVLDAADRALAQETVSLGADGSETVLLSAPLLGQGLHRVEVVAEEGGASIEGHLQVLYAA